MEENNHYEKKENITNENIATQELDVTKENTPMDIEEKSLKEKEEEKKKDLTFLLIMAGIIVVFILLMPNIYKKLNPTTVTNPSKEPEKQEEKTTNMTYNCVFTENNLEEGYELSKNTTYVLTKDEMTSIKVNASYSFDQEESYLVFKEKIQTEEGVIGEFDDVNFSYFYIVTLNKQEIQNEYPRTKDALLNLINENNWNCSITEG